MAREAGFDVMRLRGVLPHVPEAILIANVCVTKEVNRLVALVRADERAASVQEPVARQYQGRDGVWNDFISEKHYKDTLADGSWPIRNLYTDPPAQPAVPLTLPPGKCASEWGGYATGPCLYTANDVMEILAAHGITEKGD
jgi:hypothetical protein